jgi:hypothetical protein
MQEVQCGNDGCTVSDDPLDPCLPIPVPDDDYDFAANRCLKFVRSMPVPLLNCHIGVYELCNKLILVPFRLCLGYCEQFSIDVAINHNNNAFGSKFCLGA